MVVNTSVTFYIFYSPAHIFGDFVTILSRRTILVSRGPYEKSFNSTLNLETNYIVGDLLRSEHKSMKRLDEISPFHRFINLGVKHLFMLNFNYMLIIT